MCFHLPSDFPKFYPFIIHIHIISFISHQRVLEGHRHQELCHEWLQPNVVTFGALVSSCESCSAWRQALRIFRDLQARGEGWVTGNGGDGRNMEKPQISLEFSCLMLFETTGDGEER